MSVKYIPNIIRIIDPSVKYLDNFDKIMIKMLIIAFLSILIVSKHKKLIEEIEIKIEKKFVIFVS